MTSKDNLEEKLHELSQAIGSDDKLVENVMNRIHSAPACGAAGAGCIRKIIMKHSLTKLVTAAAIIIVALISISYFDGSFDGTSAVYAAAMKALQNVKTVHISGWTTCIRPHVREELLDTSKRDAVEIWEWGTEDDGYRQYYREGPIIEWDDGDRRYEYDEDNDLLHIGNSHTGVLKYCESVTSYLNKLKDRNIKVIDIGTRTIRNRPARGFRITKGDIKREDIWLDSQTNLVLEINAHVLKEGQWKQWRHGEATYDQEVPDSIRGYVPPDAEHVEYNSDIDPRFKEYHSRLREIAAYYQQHPLPETMELLLREKGETLDNSYSPGRLSGITDTTGYWVLPIQSSLADFLRRRIVPDGSLRVPDDLQKIRLNHDLITKNGHTSRERADFVLDDLGLEIVEVSEQRKVWVAHYDGRPLKTWREVKAPVARGDARHTKPGMDWISNSHTMKHLLESFAYYQGYDLRADKLIIIDETGLPSKPAEGQSEESIAVSSASPYWGGDESIEMARKWFREQFGVTFTEEIRTVTVYLVRRCNRE